MRLLYLSFIPLFRYVGGMQKVTDSIIVELKKRGHEVAAAFYEKKKVPPEIPLPCPHHYIQTEGRSWDVIIKEWEALLTDFKPDVVISLNHNEKAVMFLKNVPSSVKRVSFNHLLPFPGVEYAHEIASVMHPMRLKHRVLKWTGLHCPYLLSKYYEMAEKKVIAKAIALSDHYGVLAEGYKDRIAKYYPRVEKEKLFSLPNPNPYLYEPYKPAPKENVILYVGRLYEMPKNLSAFIRVWERLEAKNPTWKALVVGIGPALEPAKKYCKNHQLKNIFFEGRHQEVSPYYKRAKIVCVTSLFESWNMSIVEGMNYGCIPVVFHSYEATYEMIEDGVNGYLVTPFDEREMAEKIQRLIDDEALFETLSKHSIEKSRSFSLPLITDQWEEMLSQLLSSPSSGL